MQEFTDYVTMWNIVMLALLCPNIVLVLLIKSAEPKSCTLLLSTTILIGLNILGFFSVVAGTINMLIVIAFVTLICLNEVD